LKKVFVNNKRCMNIWRKNMKKRRRFHMLWKIHRHHKKWKERIKKGNRKDPNKDIICQLGKNSKKIARVFISEFKLYFLIFLATFALNFQPCYHKYSDRICSEEEQCCMSEGCGCYHRGYCDKYCGCDPNKCKIRYRKFLLNWLI